jgi:hypothetical protein
MLQLFFNYRNKTLSIWRVHTAGKINSKVVCFRRLYRLPLKALVSNPRHIRLFYAARGQFCKLYIYIKVKQSHYSPGQALRFPGGWGSQISRHSVHEGGKVVSPTHRPPLPQKIFLVLISVRGWVYSIVPEGLCQWKIPVTPLGIETATFRLVPQPTAPPPAPNYIYNKLQIM